MILVKYNINKFEANPNYQEPERYFQEGPKYLRWSTKVPVDKIPFDVEEINGFLLSEIFATPEGLFYSGVLSGELTKEKQQELNQYNKWVSFEIEDNGAWIEISNSNKYFGEYEEEVVCPNCNTQNELSDFETWFSEYGNQRHKCPVCDVVHEVEHETLENALKRLERLKAS